jgi:hypothetical protein
LAPRLHDLEAAARAQNRAIGLSTAYVGAGLIQTTSTDDTIALAVYQHLLGDTHSCPTAQPMDAQVTSDFGTTGCTLGTSQMLWNGHVTAVARHDDPKNVTVELTVDGTVDGQSLAGTIDCHTVDGNAFDYASDLTLDGVHVTTPSIMAGIADGGAQITTVGTIDQPEGTLPLKMKGLHQRFVGCYPDDGALDLSLATTLDLAFASDSPQTGSVMITQGKDTRTGTLPVRDRCPR